MKAIDLVGGSHRGLESSSSDTAIHDTGSQLNLRSTHVLIGICLFAFLLRVGIAIALPNADDSDATREAAHRLAYGYGLLNLDWQQGVRSWVFPAFVAGIMRASDWLGAGPSGYLLGIVIIMSLISLTTVWFSFMWAYRTSGIIAAFLAAGLSAIWYELVFYAPKAIYEVVAAHVLLPGLYLGAFAESIPERRRLFISGLFLGLALALRPPLTPAVVFAVAVFGLKNPRVRLPAVAVGILVPVALFGIVDAFTWPYPFYSFVRFYWVNLVQPIKSGQWAIEHQWIRPWYWYLPILALRLGPMALLAAAGLRRSAFLGWVALVILLTHALVGHKEFRFIYPMIPIALTLAALGAADVLSIFHSRSRWLRSTMPAVIVGLIPCVCLSAALAWFFPLWSRHSGNLIVFQELNGDAKVCGIALVGPEVDPVIGGNYTYLHRNLPMYFFRAATEANMRRLTPSFNAIVTARQLTYDGFELTRCWNGTCLYKRQGSCTASPEDTIKSLPVE